MLSVIAVFAISAGILLAAQSGCIGATLAGTDGSYNTPDTELSEHALVQAVTAWEGMTNLIVACQIADTFADMLFTGVLDAAYAVHGVLSLTPTDSITDGGSLVLDGAQGITIFKSGGHTYAAVAAYDDDGVQILNVTDPSNIIATESITDDDNLELDGAQGITIFKSGGNTYAAVAAYEDDGVQILNVTDPSNIIATDSITDTPSLVLNNAYGITTFESGSNTYAAVAAYNDDGVQILNVTDPSNIIATDSITDTPSLELDGASSITIFKSGGNTYAAVTAYVDDGVQILNVTDPSNIIAADSITDTPSLVLNGASSITIFKSGGNTYAAVVAYDDTGVQILNVTDPSNIIAADSITDTPSLVLYTASGITTFESGGHIYAAVTAFNDDGVQILDVTDPSNIIAADSITDTTSLELDGASSITTFKSGGHIYAAVVAYTDDGVQIIRIDITPSDTPLPADAFVTTWRTASADQSITINFVGDDMDISWGDGTTETNLSGSQTHTYINAGNHTVSVTGGLTGLTLDRPDSFGRPIGPVPELASIDQWGGISWINMNNAFAGASNMIYMATDTPDLSLVTDMSGMFSGATAFNVDVSDWDVSSVTDMSGMFSGATSFNQPLNDWDVSSVTEMSGMFSFATSFNQTLNSWDVSSVDNMARMFRGADSFNQPLNSWNVSSVTGMFGMFSFATSFNQPLNSWNVSSVTAMDDMFGDATAFDQPLNAWDVSAVTDMNDMFEGATSFNQPLNFWNVSSVTDMHYMFSGATSFNQTLNDWDVSSVTEMSGMFSFATSFNQPLNSWNVSKVSSMVEMFANTPSFQQNLGEWYVTLDPDTIAGTGIPSVVGTISAQNQPLKNHSPTYVIVDGLDKNHFEIVLGNQLNMTSGVSGKAEYSVNVTASGGSVFESGNNWRLLEIKVTGQITDTTLPADAFITTWKTTTADKSITLPISGSGMTVDWGDGNTTTASGSVNHIYNTAGDYTVSISGGLERFHLDSQQPNAGRLASIEQWGDTRWTTMHEAFYGARNMAYNATDSPDLSTVTDMSGMFGDASSFNGNISGWDVSKVTNMDGMFDEATSFNQPLNSWNVSSVKNMGWMFNDASSFNQTLNSWDVSSVTTMYRMFNNATSFNQPLNSWNVSSVTDMARMFNNADSFNQTLNSWDVSSVTDMFRMFNDATSFNQPLNSWNVSKVTSMFRMFTNADSFNQPLNSWNVSRVTNMDDMFNFATAFSQNLGEWYVTLDPDTIAGTGIPGVVGTISAQNQPLKNHSPTYVIVDGLDKNHFEIVLGNQLNMTSGVSGKAEYSVNVTASGGSVFESGNNWRVLAVRVSGDNNADLGGLTISSGTLSPSFSSSDIAYTASVDNSVTQVTVTPTASDSSATIAVNGNTVTSGNGYIVTGLNVGEPTTVTVIVTAQDSTTKTYTVTLTRATLSDNADLGSLTISSGTLSPSFSSSVTAYTASVDNSVTQVTVTPTASDSLATITVNGNAVTSGTGHIVTDLNVGTNTITVLGIAQDITIKIYTITITRAAAALSDNADLGGLTISSGTLSPSFSSSDIAYTASVDNTITQVTVTPIASHSLATIAVNGNTVTSGTGYIVTGLTVGEPTTVTVIVAAQDSTTKTYTVTLTRAAALSDTPPTFVSSKLDSETGVLTIIFSKDIDATPNTRIVPDKIHIRESGSYTGGVTLTAGELGTTADGTTISFTLNVAHLKTVAELSDPKLTIDPGAVQDTSGNLIEGTFDVSTATYVRKYSVESGNSTLTDVEFSNNGTKMFIVGGNGDDVTPYALIRAFDLTHVSPFGAAFSLSPYNPAPQSLEFSNDGTKMFVIGIARDNVTGYALSTAFDVSTATYVNAFNVRSEDHNPQGLAFSNDGTKMFVVGQINKHVYEYTLPTAFDVSTAVHVYSFPVESDVRDPFDVEFSNDGTKMFVVDRNHNNVHQYTLSTAFDVSTATFTNVVFSVSGQNPSPRGMAFSNDGTKMFVVGSYSSNVNEYALSSVYPLSVVSNMVPADDHFVTTWRTGADNETVTIPVYSGPTYYYTVIWGDGTNSTGVTDNAIHTYAAAGDHQVRIYGIFLGIHLDGHADASKLASIDQWGSNRWASMASAFKGASSMKYEATDAPDLSGVTNMTRMFSGAESFNGDLSNWNVSQVTDMSSMFAGADAFNGDISSWSVSQVTDMSSMFAGADAFDGDISSWSVSQVTDMSSMFAGADAFDGDISSWSVSQVTDMSYMFSSADNFNQPLNRWDVSAVTTMSNMFASASAFNPPLNDWDVSSVTDMSGMFHFALNFNRPLNNWNVSDVTDMSGMFQFAFNFDQNLGEWYVTLDPDTIAGTGIPGVVGTISAQNQPLKNHSPTYVIVDGLDKNHFEIVHGNQLNMTSGVSGKAEYSVNVAASGSNVFESDNNWRLLKIKVTGQTTDTTPPVIKLEGSSLVTITVDDTYTEQGATCEDDVDADKPATVGGDTVDTSTVGQYTVTYDCTDTSNNEATQVSRTVNVQSAPDTDAPVIIITGSANIQLTVDDTYTEQGAVCEDNVDADKAATVGGDTVDTSTVGQYTVTYDCTDSSNNEATQVSRTVNVQSAPDTDAPVIIITGSANIQLTVDDTYTEQGAVCEDNVDADKAATVGGDTVDTSTAGQYTVTYDCTDSSNNEATQVSRTVNVQSAPDTDAPVIIITGLTNIQLTVDETYTEQGAVCEDNVDADKAATVGGDTVDTSTAGQYTVTYDCTDSSNNEATQVSRTVNVQSAPDTTLPADAFVTTWRTASADQSITINFVGDDMNISWGDDGMTETNLSGSQTHTYINAGNHTVSVTGGLTGFHLNDAADASKLVSLDQWGNTTWTTMENAFYGADNMAYNAADSPDLSTVTDMTSMFRGASSFNGNISGWDVSSVTDMFGMFASADSFNQPLNSWDVSSVTDMFGMFYEATDFNQPLNSWNVSSVNNMDGMFLGASSFNQPLNNWDVSKVTDMRSMFYEATDFNQPLNDWDVSRVTNMDDMFYLATAFSQNLGEWYVTLDPDTIAGTGIPGVVGTISAQNQPLKNHSPTYVIVDGLDKNHFEIVPGNQLNMTSGVSGKAEYSVNVTASGGSVFESGNNWRLLEIKVTGQITDTTPPVIKLEGSSLVTITVDDTYTEQGAVCDDDVDADKPATVGGDTVDTSTAGQYTVTYDCTDTAGNVATQVLRTVNVQSAPDTDAPVIIITGLTNIQLTVDETYTEQGATCEDNVDADKPATVGGDTVDTSTAGQYTVTYDCTDSSNNEATQVSRTVNVQSAPDTDAPVIIITGLTNIQLTVDETYTEQGATCEDNVDADKPATVGGDTVDTSTVGQYTVTYDCTDSSNNEATQVSRTVNVQTAVTPVTTLPADAFITTWRTDSANQTITIPVGGSTARYSIDWGDNSPAETDITGDSTHTYREADSYTVSISGGLERIYLDGQQPNAGRLASIEQWGDTRWTTMDAAFYGARNMAYNAADSPDLSTVTDMSGMFGDAIAFNGDLSSWDVSKVTDMSDMFIFASDFNGNLSSWDVSSVTNMNEMFAVATSFNGDLSSWDVSKVTDMSYMFIFATSFNGNLSSWDVSAVTDMSSMFDGATAFNGDLSSWDVSSVTDMNNMFYYATSFNQPLNDWDVSSVTEMDGMFFYTPSFTQNLGNWYVVANATSIARADVPGVVAEISAQNDHLNGHNPTYGIGSDNDYAFFEIVNGNKINMTSVGTKSSYMVNVTASGSNVFEDGNNWRLLEIKVTDQTTDTTPPVIKLEGSSLVTITVDDTYTELGATCEDNVDADKPATVGGDTVDTSTAGQYTVTYDCTDSSNNEATQVSRTVNVQSAPDTDAPVIIITGSANIQLTVDETYTEQGATCEDNVDADKPATVGGDTVDTSTAGQYTVTYDCTDSSNNEATQVSRTVNVQSAPDTDAPVIIITGLTNIQLTVDETYTEQGATCEDNVDADKPATVGGDTVDTSTAGQYTVTYDCTDSSNNEATQVSRTVNVQSAPDTDAPVIIITGSANIQLTVDETYTEQGATCEDNVDADKPATVGGDTVDTSTAGQYTVTYDCTDSSNNEATQVSRTVNVQSAPDTDAPVIIITGSANIQLTVDETYTEEGATCEDNVDADKPATVGGDTVDTSTVGQYTVTYDCTDSSNNEATQVSRTVNVQSAPDTDAPVIIITGLTNIQLTVDETYTEEGATCEDNVDADKPATVGGDTVDTSTVGQYTVTYDCTDSSNNEATQVSRTVNVQSAPDTDAPVIIITGLTNIQLTVDETYTEEGATCEDNVDADKPATVGGDTVDTSTVGQYTVTYDCTDSSNNEATQVSRTVNVQTAVTPVTTLPADAFITTWRTDSANQTITIPVGGSTARYSIDWGDNSPAETDITGDSTHTYREADSYTVSISGGLERIYLDGQQPNAGRLASIEQWGDTRWTTMDAAFYGARNMAYNAADSPDLSTVTDMSGMFGDAIAFNGDLSSWDVSKVTDMSDMFIFAYDFNGNLSSWDVSSVTNMNEMFAVATSFNGDLSSWDVSKVTDMSYMFIFATSFNGDLSSWDVSAVTDMSSMFDGATAFNGDLSSWDVSSVTDMNNMFYYATSFNQPLNDWDVSSVTEMDGMFFYTPSFTQNLGNWYVVANATSIARADVPGVVAEISAQNDYLNGHNPTYGIGSDNDYAFFEIVNGNKINMTSVGTKSSYMVNVTASGSNVFEDGNNWRLLEIKVTGQTTDTTSPVIKLEGSSLVTITVDDTYTELGATCEDNVDADKPATVGGDTVDTSTAGQYTVTYDCTDSSNNEAIQVSRTVNVQSAPDTDAPVIIITGSANIQLTVDDTYTELGATCEDNVDADKPATVGGDTVDTSTAGQYTVTYDCTDSSNNEATQVSRTVNVQSAPDTDAPVIIITGSANIQLTVDETYTEEGATCEDNVDADKPATVGGDTVDTSTAGQYTVTYDCTDSSNNEATQVSRTVNVQSAPDTDAPVIIITGSANIQLTVDETYTEEGATCEDNVDADKPATVGGDTVDTSTAGQYTVTYDCTDSSNNEATQVSRTVNVQSAPDTDAPVIIITGLTNIQLTVDETYTEEGATCEDNVDADKPATVGGDTVDTSTAGQYTVTYDCTDSSNNEATQVSRTVNVQSAPDTDAPVIIITGSANIQLTVDETYTEQGATCEDNVDADKPATVGGDTVDTSTAGQYTVTYDCTDSSNNEATQVSRTVNVQSAPDTDAPVIIITGSANIQLTVDETYTEEGATCEDNVDADKPATVGGDTVDTSTVGQYTVTYDCTDSSNNEATQVSRTVNVQSAPDTDAPVIIITGLTNIQLTVDETYTEEGATCEDNVDADKPATVGGDTVDTSTVGQYTVTYDCTDSSNNEATQVSRTVNVQSAPDTDAPVIIITGLTNIQLTVDETYTEEGATCEDNVDADKPATVGGDTVDTSTVGQYTVTYDCTDTAGNVATQVLRTVNVQDAPDTTLLADAFITTWRTDSANQTITIPVGGSTARYSIDWGDNSPAETDITGDSTHTYREADSYTVSISGGLERIYLDGQQPNAGRLASIEQWGDTRWTTMDAAFYGARNMAYNAADSPDLSTVTDMSGMFGDAIAFNGDLSSWDVSKVTDMSDMFIFAYDFNGNLSSWDVSSVTNMNEMFAVATSFNGDLSSWDVSKVTDMSYMFIFATSFNGNLSSWDVSAVTDMSSMFDGATAFNGDLSSWDVSSVTDMNNMFYYDTSFNQPLNDWDVSSVTEMDGMFFYTPSFTQNLGNWYVVANATSIARADVPGVVAEISAQNDHLNGHNPTYGISSDNDYAFFEIVNGNKINMTSVGTKSSYMVNVTASGSNVFEDGNNWRLLEIKVTGQITDTTPPVIKLEGSSLVTITVDETYTEEGAVCDDDVDADKPATVGGDTVDTSTVGQYTVTYDCTYSSNNEATQVSRTVNVQSAPDTDAPVIMLTGLTSIQLTVDDTYTELGATCRDNVDADKPATVGGDTVDTSTVGQYTVTYDCTDSSNNEATQVSRTVNVQSAPDTDAPVIMFTGLTNIQLTVDDTYTEQGAVCDDDVDADKPATVGGDTVDTSTVGQYTVTYDCTDSSNNEATQVSRTVNVQSAPDTDVPVIIITGSANIQLTVGDTYTEEGATCDDDVDADKPATVGGDTVDTSTVGQYTVTYDCTDSSNNEATQVSRTVNVVST